MSHGTGIGHLKTAAQMPQVFLINFASCRRRFVRPELGKGRDTGDHLMARRRKYVTAEPAAFAPDSKKSKDFNDTMM